MADSNIAPKSKSIDVLKGAMTSKLAQLTKNKNVPIAGVIIATMILAILIVITIVFWATDSKGGRIGVGIVVLILNVIQFGIAFHYLYKRQLAYAKNQKELDEITKQSQDAKTRLDFIKETNNIGTGEIYDQFMKSIDDARATYESFKKTPDLANYDEWLSKSAAALNEVHKAEQALAKYKEDAKNKKKDEPTITTQQPVITSLV